MSEFHAGLKLASNWHKKQAKLMQEIIEDCKSGRITTPGTKEKALLFAEHHNACAVLILNLDSSFRS